MGTAYEETGGTVWAWLEVQQVMNGEKGCGFLFPLLIAMEKISEK